MKEIEKLIAKSQELSKKALLGCEPQIYEEMSALLTEIVPLIQGTDAKNIASLNTVIRDLLQAQELHDLYRISDTLGYEMPYVLKMIAGKQ